MHRDPNCQLCPLHKTAQYVCLLGKGPEPCDVMFVGEAPGQREDDSGKPFVGRAGRLLDDLMSETGWSRQEVFITNAVSCRPPDNRTPRGSEIEKCKKWLNYQIAMVKPKFILAMGNVPLQALTGQTGIKKLRGRPIEKDGITIFPTFHPSFALRQDFARGVIEQDLREFKNLTEGEERAQSQLNVTVVDNWSKVDQMLEAMTGVVAPDLETTCLYPWAPEAAVVTVGFGTRTGQFSIPINHPESPWDEKDIEKILDLATDKLDDCTAVFQNGKFDCLWMLVHYRIKWRNDFDIMLAHYIINENSLHDLEFLAQLYLGVPGWDVPLPIKQGKGSYSKLAQYHGFDLLYTRQIYFKIVKELRKDLGVKRVFDHLLMPAANLFVEMEEHGCYIDTDKMGDESTGVEGKLRRDIEAADEDLKQYGDINWKSPKQVGALLYGKLKIKCPLLTKKGAQSTAESALKQIDHPCVGSLLKRRGAQQQLSFFIEGWKPYIVRHRIHPSFKLHGTVTGRPSCEHPNFQQVPRDVLIRSLITAPPGWSIVEGDLSQIELRIVAELSRIPAMMEAFLNGVDIHWLTAIREIERGAGQGDLIKKTARKLTGKSLSYSEALEAVLEAGPDTCVDIDIVWKEVRKKAKAINFGYVFGMWWKKFKIYARDNYDVHLTDRQARDSRIAFFDLYPLEGWHSKQKSFARMNGFVRSLTGRKRRLLEAQSPDDTPQRAEAWRQAINSPVQSLASDLNLMVLLQMAREFPRQHVKPLITVHDSILLEVRNSWVERVSHRFEEIMRGPELLKTFEISFKVPIMGETKIGAWGSGVSLKKWLITNDEV